MEFDIQSILAKIQNPAELERVSTQLAEIFPPPVAPQQQPQFNITAPGAGISPMPMPTPGLPVQTGGASVNPFPQSPMPGGTPTPTTMPLTPNPVGAAAMPPDMGGLQPAPAKSPEELTQRKFGWNTFMQSLASDPEKQQMLLRVGVAMMQPVQPGESPLGNAGKAMQVGADYLNTSRAARTEGTRKNAELALRGVDAGSGRISAEATKSRAETDKAQLPFQQMTAEASKLTAEASMYRAKNPVGNGGGEAKKVQQINQLAQALATQNAAQYASSPILTSGPSKGLPAQAVLDAQTVSKSKSAEEVAANLLQRSMTGLETDEELLYKAQQAYKQAQVIFDASRAGTGLSSKVAAPAKAGSDDPLGLRKK